MTKNYRDIPGDPTSLLRGNLPDIKRANGLHCYLDELHARRGDTVRLSLGPTKHAVSSISPEAIARLNQSGWFDKRPSLIRASRTWLGEGNIAEQSGETSRRTRSHLTPILAGDTLRMVCDVGVPIVQQELEQFADEDFDLTNACRNITLQIMGECLFGADFRQGIGVDIGQRFMRVLRTNPIKVGPPIPPLWKSSYWRWRREVRALHERVSRLIDMRHGEPSSKDKTDLLGLLLSARGEDGELFFSEPQARMAVLAFYFGGVEATSATTLWCAAYLAAHPKVLASVQEELDSVLQGRAPKYNDLSKLEVLKTVIKETLRICSPSPVNMRVIQKDFEIDGYQVPAGTIFFLSIIAMHHSERLWPEPLAFKPERFTDDADKKLPRYAYMPFGVGAKGCLGGTFATIEISMILACLLQHYSISWPGEPQLEGVFHSGALIPKMAHTLVLTKR